MSTIVLPFELPANIEGIGERFIENHYYKELPKMVQGLTEEYPFLLDYFGMLPLDQIGLPLYCPELSRKMSGEKNSTLSTPANVKVCSSTF